VTVVVATRDRPEQLNRCLASVQVALGPDDEVVVVDSASRDDRTAAVATAAGARVVRAELPGTSRARNLGWRAASHPLVAFTDDDVEVTADWLDAMAASLTAPGRRWVTGWVGVSKPRAGTQESNPLVAAAEPAVLDARHRGSFGASANLGAHRDLLEAVGGFDERFGPGTWTAAAEDVELFDRFLAAGATGYYDPGVRVFHEQWRGRRDAMTLHWRYGKGMGGRLALLARRDLRRAARTSYEVVVTEGLAAVVRCLRARYEFGAAVAGVRVLGIGAGFLAWVLRPSASSSGDRG
jgi:glycosyltransferase involved in cell wall biosynthesis